MVNFAYLIGDRAKGVAVVVDPAYGVGELLDVAAADGVEVVGALVSHHHPDHVGGSLFGHTIEGVAELLGRVPVPIHAHRDEVDSVRRITGASAGDVVGHVSGERVMVGDVGIELLHTPGHTPGSQCFLVDGRLVSGDTLFLEGCGRTDLPGSDPAAMYRSLSHLASLPDETVIYPGHRYSVASTGTLVAVKEINMVFKPATEQAWLTMFGA
jgi:glyoxylase-like metal-dependent hydrolase (beta-lactamase superfamily II)